jgi:N-acetyl-1-D-myo-inositol-2-amino-2-deoxy-alpha-D-glucopyranoside deacetylase
VEVVREVRPHVLVTYDPNGDYGHPDHILAHRVATAAAERAADPAYGQGPPWQVAKLYWTATPKSVLKQGFEAIQGQADLPFGVASVDELPFGVDDELVTTAVDASGFGEQKLAALRAHRTQIAVDGEFFALSNKLGREALAMEYFRLAHGTLGPDQDADGRERDLFSGLEL